MSNSLQTEITANNSSEFQKQQQSKAIIGIIADYIMYRRIVDGLHIIQNAFNPNGHAAGIDDYGNFKGPDNAFLLMGVQLESEDSLKLRDIAWEIIDKSDRPADQLAVDIYIEWLVEIKNQCLTLKTVA